MGLHSAPWEYPSPNTPTNLLVSLQDVPPRTPGLRQIRIDLQHLALALSTLGPDLVTDGEDDEGNDSDTDTAPQEDTPAMAVDESQENAAPLPPATSADELRPQDKGKAKATSAEPETDGDEVMGLIDAETQKDLAGRAVLSMQNLILQDPKVSRLFCPLYNYSLNFSRSAIAVLLAIEFAPSIRTPEAKGVSSAASLASRQNTGAH